MRTFRTRAVDVTPSLLIGDWKMQPPIKIKDESNQFENSESSVCELSSCDSIQSAFRVGLAAGGRRVAVRAVLVKRGCLNGRRAQKDSRVSRGTIPSWDARLGRIKPRILVVCLCRARTLRLVVHYSRSFTPSSGSAPSCQKCTALVTSRVALQARIVRCSARELF